MTILSILNKIRAGEMYLDDYEDMPHHTLRPDDEFSLIKINKCGNKEADILLTGLIISIMIFVSS